MGENQKQRISACLTSEHSFQFHIRTLSSYPIIAISENSRMLPLQLPRSTVRLDYNAKCYLAFALLTLTTLHIALCEVFNIQSGNDSNIYAEGITYSKVILQVYTLAVESNNLHSLKKVN